MSEFEPFGQEHGAKQQVGCRYGSFVCMGDYVLVSGDGVFVFSVLRDGW